MTELDIVALVPVGAHPISGRPRRAEQDVRAVEFDLHLNGLRLQVLHAGDLRIEALRGYLDMGLECLPVLGRPASVDVLSALAGHLRDSCTQLVFIGNQAETREGLGTLLFLLAERLGWLLVAGLAEVEKARDGSAQVLQVLPHGQRHRLWVYLPFVTSVDNAAPVVQQDASDPARRSEIETHEMEVVGDPLLVEDNLQPARLRPKQLKVTRVKIGVERMKAVTAKASGGIGQVLRDLLAEIGAEVVFKLLRKESVIC